MIFVYPLSLFVVVVIPSLVSSVLPSYGFLGVGLSNTYREKEMWSRQREEGRERGGGGRGKEGRDSYFAG